MRKDLEKQLEIDFPFMARSRAKDEPNPYELWGCECGDGWYNLIHNLCKSISERYELYGKPVDIVILQVKEKFATLRFYYEFIDSPCPIQAVDFLDNGSSLRMSPESPVDEQIRNLRKDIAEIVRSYEEKSASVCEICGLEGKTRKLRSGYILTLCENCYNGHLSETEEKKK